MADMDWGTKQWWQKKSTWIVIFALTMIVTAYLFLGEDTESDVSEQPSEQVKIGTVETKQDKTIIELRDLVGRYDANRANSEAMQIEILAKLKEIEERLVAIEKCACKKPVKAKAKGKPKVIPKPVVAPAASVVSPVYEPPKSCCEWSQPKPAIIKPGHMPLGALPSARCPNCDSKGEVK